jgi:DMSO/TMAO reductase YedYZ molybdopterin-dependent catalytic subunit
MPYFARGNRPAIRLGPAREHRGVTGAPRPRLALAGAVAALAGTAAAELLTSVLNARATPIQAVAEVVIARTPGSVAEALIQLVGHNDKSFLAAGITVVIVLLGAWAGVLTARRKLFGFLVFAAMGVVALLALLSRPDFTPYSVLPLVLGVFVWVVLLEYLTSAAAPAPQPAVDASRRRFLLSAGGVALAAVVVGAGGRWFGRSRRAVEAARERLHLPVTRGVVPAGAEGARGSAVPGLSPWRTSDLDFYRIDTAVVLPAVDPDTWRLRIHGMVDREVTLSYRDLLDRQLTEAWVTLCCVSNPVGGDLIGNAWWSGVRIADLLREAGVHPDADAVQQTSADGWTCGTPVQALTDGRNAMLAVAMNGRPLPVEHGFPVRMVVPGLYGFVSATKWLVDLEVTRFDRFQAFWTRHGWSARGPVKTQSRVEVPRGGVDVPAGPVRVGGHAWAQHTGIRSVEYRLDGHPWHTAELGRVPGNDTWVQWSGTVHAPAGRHTVTVRATDRSGYTQTAVRTDVVPDGATGWHRVEFTAR